MAGKPDVQQGYPSVRPYLPHALAATAAVVGIPFLVTILLTTLSEPDPPILMVAAAGVLSSLLMIVIGTALWLRRPASSFIGFGDLMIARWMKRLRTERQLHEGARMLGLDRSGQPVTMSTVTPEQQLQVLHDLTAALEAKDPYTLGHSRRVERHSYHTATAMGLSESDVEDLRKAASLHDVGKIRVPDHILRKRDPLTDEERHVMEEHAIVGAWMVSQVGNTDVISAVRHHHERWDGAGYPDGIAGTEIPLFARIIAVADCYDALVSSRPYRAGCGRDEAVQVLKAEAGRQFDPNVVDHFIASLPARLPIAAGMLVLLAGPGRLLRELFAFLRRFGAGGLSPAVGAAGAAVVLGASVFTPSLPPRVERPQARVVDQSTEMAESFGLQAVEVSQDTEGNGKKHPKRRQQSAVVAAPAPAPAEPEFDSEVLGETITRDADPVASEPQPEPEPEQPVVEPTPEPTPEPEAPSDTTRNPNDDNDGCTGDGDAGKGNDDRCGD